MLNFVLTTVGTGTLNILLEMNEFGLFLTLGDVTVLFESGTEEKFGPRDDVRL